MTSKPDSLKDLTEIIRSGLEAYPKDGLKKPMTALFGDRYQKRDFEPTMLRDAYGLANEGEDSGVPYAGFINPANPPSGPYGGTSLVWFPTSDAGTLIGFGVGTRGLTPDEGILMRPGHRRRIVALRRYLSWLGVEAWTKPDPAALGVVVPKGVRERFPGFEKTFQRYGREMYCNAVVPRTDAEKAHKVVQAFIDLYALERNWQILKAFEPEYTSLHDALRANLFIVPNVNAVNDLLQQRRFVILQGPPGTGKTRLAGEVLKSVFKGHGMTVQFHPAITYEDFVVGLSPNEKAGSLQFHVRKGWLLEAIAQAKDHPFLLIVDEVNRADLGKVLGEAIFLFEAGEVGGKQARKICLPHPVDGISELSIPENFYLLATMNTADRSIQNLDLAVRRRFAFMTVSPNRAVVAENAPDIAASFFDRLAEVFVEHAPADTLDLMPGHAYFLADNEDELKSRFRHELIPLIDEYLRQGFLGPASSELHAVRDALEDWIH
ncbi:MAG: restriction endonuclease [Deltaproteobacteria bacterium]|nr:restriction endonuclease [Deltaproteobacteria bacterium]